MVTLLIEVGFIRAALAAHVAVAKVNVAFCDVTVLATDVINRALLPFATRETEQVQIAAAVSLE